MPSQNPFKSMSYLVTVVRGGKDEPVEESFGNRARAIAYAEKITRGQAIENVDESTNEYGFRKYSRTKHRSRVYAMSEGSGARRKLLVVDLPPDRSSRSNPSGEPGLGELLVVIAAVVTVAALSSRA